ncbi:MAG: CoA transferase [Acidobacteria bacterium]|nr:CoA transferase [Acidobacteriota bacterium]
MKPTPPETPIQETVSGLVSSLPDRLRPDRASGWRACLHLKLSEAEVPEWTVRVEDGRCEVAPGLAGDPTCVVRMKGETYVAIETGRINPQVAFMMGKVKVSNIAEMMMFVKAFRPAGPTTASRAADPGAEERRDDMGEQGAGLPLTGTTVVDLTRMLPGAVLARMLADFGARVIKVEDPAGGDPLRNAPPLVGGVGAGFCAFYRGCSSLALDLREPAGAATVRRLVRRADVLVESFRPGTLDGWGLGTEQLRAINPSLVICSLSGFGDAQPWRRQAAHDLNFTGLSGLLSLLPGEGVPGIQVVDVSTGMLACSAILAALLHRQRTGKGAVVEQPLAAAPLPFVLWPWSDRAAGGVSIAETVLAGRCPAYRRYRCADGLELAVAALEPKFWADLVTTMSLPHLAGAGLDTGDTGEHAAAELSAAFSGHERAHWLTMLGELGLPVSAVNDLAAARDERLFSAGNFLERTPTPGGGFLVTPGPFCRSVGATPGRPAPGLGEHTAEILAELGDEDSA